MLLYMEFPRDWVKAQNPVPRPQRILKPMGLIPFSSKVSLRRFLPCSRLPSSEKVEVFVASLAIQSIESSSEITATIVPLRIEKVRWLDPRPF
jgi:hypothetical protein